MMKKLIIFLTFLILTISVKAQFYSLPPQNLGSINVLVRDSGGMFVRQTFVPPVLPDTSTFPLGGYPKNYNFSFVGSTADTSMYFRFNGKWYKLATTSGGNPINAWNLIGNTGTTAGTNFVGTTDNQDLVFKRNNVQSGLLDNDLENTSFGVNSLPLNATGFLNTINGWNAGRVITSGSRNTLIGSASGGSITTAMNNTGVGYSTLLNIQSNQFNTAIGGEAGISLANGNGDGNTFIGQYANPVVDSVVNYGVALGFAAHTLSKTLTLSDSIHFITAVGLPTGTGYVLTDVLGNGHLSLQPSGTGGSPTLQNVFNNGNILNRNDSIVATGHSFKLFADNIFIPQPLPSGSTLTDSVVLRNGSTGELTNVDISSICTGSIQSVIGAIVDSTSNGNVYLKVHVALGLLGQGSAADPIIVDTGYLSTLYHTDSSFRALTLQQSIINNDTLTQNNVIHSEGFNFVLNANGINFTGNNLVLGTNAGNGLLSESNGYTALFSVGNYLELISDTDILFTTQLSIDTLTAGGGTAGQVLTSNGLGRWSWEDAGGGGGNTIYTGNGQFNSDRNISGQGLYGETHDSLANGFNVNVFNSNPFPGLSLSNQGAFIVDQNNASVLTNELSWSNGTFDLTDKINNYNYVDAEQNSFNLNSFATGSSQQVWQTSLTDGIITHHLINSGNIFDGLQVNNSGGSWTVNNGTLSYQALVLQGYGSDVKLNNATGTMITAAGSGEVDISSNSGQDVRVNSDVAIDLNPTTSVNITNTDNTQVPLIVTQAASSTQDVLAMGRSGFGNFAWLHADGNLEATSLTQDVFNSSMVTTDGSGKLIAATAGTDYIAPNGLGIFSNYYTSSATPSIAAGAGAGTSPTVSVVGTNNDGVITVTTGTTPSASGTIATITLSGGFAFPNNSAVVLTPIAGTAAQVLSGASMVGTTGGTTTWSLSAGTVALTGLGTTYSWAYHCGGF